MRTLDWQTGDRAELQTLIRQLLIGGFWDYTDVTEWVAAWVDDSRQVQRDEALALVQSMWAEQLARQATWTDTGDFGRLQHTFAQLETEGVLARMCFSCCTTCATQEIDDERTPNTDPADWYRYREWAYTYFHEQDAMRIGLDKQPLFLGFSAFRPHPALPDSLLRAAARGDLGAEEEATDRTETMLGARIVQLAEHFGLRTEWSGSRHERIRVTVDQWRKPLPR